MKKLSHFLLGTAVIVAGAASAQAAILYSTGFETDQSSNFTVVTTSADTEANFNFDYSTWVPTAPTVNPTSIPAAPSGAGTRALKIRANFDLTGTNEGVTAYINASAGLATYTLSFDAYQLWNGPDGAVGTGTTTSMSVGKAVNTSAMYGGATAFDGWWLFMVNEGGQGASGDFRYYSGTGGAPVSDLTTMVPLFANVNMPGAAGTEWDTVFTSTANGAIAGTPGRQWVRWQITADAADGNRVRARVTPQGGLSHVIANWNNAIADTGKASGIGFWDHNTGSVADPASDNFILIDNLVLEDTALPGVNEWTMYN